MYNIKLYDSLPEVRAATVKRERIVAAHVYPVWTVGEAGLHNAFYDLENYPERTPLGGYYNESSPNVQDVHIKWALEHGINCFIYCWYRKPENVGKPISVSDLRAGRGLHDGFLKASLCDKMQFSVMYEMQKPWGATDSDDIINNLMPFWCENYFSRPNYLKIDNRPVLFIYDNSRQLADSFKSADEQRACFERVRELARSYGFDGMYIAVEYRKEDMSVIPDFKARGYDFSFAYCWEVKKELPCDDDVVADQLRQNDMRLEGDPDFFVPTASCMWDPSPRFRTILKQKAIEKPECTRKIWKLQPESFRTLLRGLTERMDALPDGCIASRMLMLDNWNEWDEGHYILPSFEFGFKYLQAVREELTERDNLPDYRLPDVLGVPYENTWGEPDLGGSSHPLDPSYKPYIKVEKV